MVLQLLCNRSQKVYTHPLNLLSDDAYKLRVLLLLRFFLDVACDG